MDSQIKQEIKDQLDIIVNAQREIEKLTVGRKVRVSTEIKDGPYDRDVLSIRGETRRIQAVVLVMREEGVHFFLHDNRLRSSISINDIAFTDESFPPLH